MKKLLVVFVVLVFFSACSKDTLPVAPVVKMLDSSEKQAAPLGNFTFDLTAPTDYYGCAIGESVTMRWEQPFRYCAGFQSYDIFVNGIRLEQSTRLIQQATHILSRVLAMIIGL